MKTIAIDALGIGRPGGGRTATLNLLEPLLSIDKENQYIVFLDDYESGLQQPNVRQIVSPVHGRLSSRLWAQFTWPTLLRRENVQLIHHTKNLVTTGNPCPTLVTIFDLTILAHPEIYPAIDVLYWRTVEKYNLRRITQVIAISRATANDLQHYYHIPKDKITVIYAGIADSFQPIASEGIKIVRQKYHLPQRYLLHVGSIWPKKNLATLVKAYQQLCSMDRYSGGLVLVGREYNQNGDAELEQAIAASIHPDTIIRTGPVPQEDLPAIMSGADCFVFPSLHEGFGLVPLEAMSCGVPVIAARSSAVEEVLGDAAMFVDDPRAVDMYVEKLSQLLGNPALRSRLVEAGTERAAMFSRYRVAQATLALYLALSS
jgi:glycosyltransferase involved in cell wall biosynthesis